MSYRDYKEREYDNWSRTDQFYEDLERSALYSFFGVLFVCIALAFLFVGCMSIASM